MVTVNQSEDSTSHGSPDLTNCDREPIHIPGSIQPHGMLLVLDEKSLTVIQTSQNVDRILGRPVETVLGTGLETLFGAQTAKLLHQGLNRAPSRSRPVLLGTINIPANQPDNRFHALAHRTEGGIILEFEPAEEIAEPEIHALLDAFTLRVEDAHNLSSLSRMTAQEVRSLTGFDRVLIYRFDEAWNGQVIGEDGNGRLPSLFNHHFPASDIPAQARELYRLSRVRIIPDASYQPVALLPAANPVTGKPLDMTFSALRSVSPVHVEYMRNMETASSMSVSIIRNGKLWGLISCHHREPLAVSFTLRNTCDLISRAFALRLLSLEHAVEYERGIEVRSNYATLVAVMADRGDFAAALTSHPDPLLSFAAAEGAAVLTAGNCSLIGKTPNEEQVRELANWLFTTMRRDVYSTDSLSSVHAPAREYLEQASGLLSIAISRLHPSYVMWFRPEVVKTLEWGGDPHKGVEKAGGQLRIHPRRSFETWRETVREKSQPWLVSELEGAAELRNTIVGTVLRKAEELAELNDELTRSNRELEAFSYSVSHDLRAPLRHIVGYAEMLKENASEKLSPNDQRCIATIIESSEYAGKLVDKLLGFARLGRAQLQLSRIDLNILVGELIQDVRRDAPDRNIEWKVGELPAVDGDVMMLRMAVRDLLSNAIKYTRDTPEAVIEVGTDHTDQEYVMFVKDNGVGFDMAYVDKLFGIFQRLHKWEDYEGTGIGLANVRRVIERHGGRTWAYGEEGRGATFYLSLPRPTPEPKGTAQ